MDIRDAVEADAERMAALSASPPDVMRNLIHDRTVRVATESAGDSADDGAQTETDDDAEETTTESEGSEAETNDEHVVGFVSFDARGNTVHVTQIAGSEGACTELIQEPVGFARREGMAVELLVPQGDDDVRSAIENAGFENDGAGPRFEGEPTTRYRLQPSPAQQ